MSQTDELRQALEELNTSETNMAFRSGFYTAKREALDAIASHPPEPAEGTWLREYAEHKPGCAKYINWTETNCAPRHSVVQFEYDDNQQCSCGLDAVLRAQPPKETKG